MVKNRRFFLALLQIALWAAFIALPYFMVPRQAEQISIDEFLKHHLPLPDQAQNIFLSSLAFNILLIAFFYIHHYFIFNRYVITRRFTEYIIITTSSFLIIFIASYFIKKYFFNEMPTIFHPISFREVIRAITWYLLVLLISLGIKLLTQWTQAEQRAQQIENEQLRTELSFLHAQINPHFLFNSLNTIYSLAFTKSDTAPLAVLKLSQLLRYVIDDASRDKVSLEQEINYLNNYIELQKLRRTASVTINFTIEGDISSTSIAPMLLLPFVENAFKYGISTHQPSPVDIKLTRSEKTLVFSVKNKNFGQVEKHSTGIGINNVQRRLELLYPDKHELDIQDSNGTYFVKLTLHYL